jgi:hypothetical protein
MVLLLDIADEATLDLLVFVGRRMPARRRWWW